MNPITLSPLARLNWCIEAIIAKAFEPGYDECGSAHQAEKISRADQEKGG